MGIKYIVVDNIFKRDLKNIKAIVVARKCGHIGDIVARLF